MISIQYLNQYDLIQNILHTYIVFIALQNGIYVKCLYGQYDKNK